MKTAILIIAGLGAALLVAGWLTERYASASRRADMDSLPAYVLGGFLLSSAAVLTVGFMIWKVFAA